MTIVICKTTKEDWEQAECHSATNCVLARAVQRGARNKSWQVSGDTVYSYQKNVFAYTPDWADEEARLFDINGNYSLSTLKEMHTGGIPDFGYDLIQFRFNTQTGEMFDRKEIGNVEVLATSLVRIENGVHTLTEEERLIFEWIRSHSKSDTYEFDELYEEEDYDL